MLLLWLMTVYKLVAMLSVWQLTVELFLAWLLTAAVLLQQQVTLDPLLQWLLTHEVLLHCVLITDMFGAHDY